MRLVAQTWCVFGSSPHGTRPYSSRFVAGCMMACRLSVWVAHPEVVADYRVAAPADKTLIELTAWAALTAARTVVAWSPATWTPTVPEH